LPAQGDPGLAQSKLSREKARPAKVDDVAMIRWQRSNTSEVNEPVRE
jgi:hypothetical protein